MIPIYSDTYEEHIELFLEQYFLLQLEFNLNTLKVANKISGSRSKPIFVYDENNVLIYRADNQEEIIFGLNIHYQTVIFHIQTGLAYLDKVYFKDICDSNFAVKEKLLSLDELFAILQEAKLEILSKKGRKVIIESEDGKIHQTFDSISTCLLYLNTIAPSYKTTLYRYIESGKPYNGFICKWGSEKVAHISEKGIEVIITNIETKEIFVLPTLRKAALWFEPKTTGQTLKAYIENGKIFKGKYLLKYGK